MEQKASILSSLIQKGPVTKNKGELGLSNSQPQEGSVEFGAVMHNVLQSAQIKLQDESVLTQDTTLVGLEQQITALSVETEDLLAVAEPEDVEGILSQAVTQLWELIESFDIQNGTEYVSNISVSLAETAHVITDTQKVSDVAELFAGTFIQSSNPLVAETVVTEIPTRTGRMEVQSLMFSQAQPQAQDAPLFANVTNLLQKSEPLAQNGQQPSPTLQAIVNAPVLEGVKVAPITVSDWSQQIQQFTVESPLKKQGQENTLAGQVTTEAASTGNNVNAGIIQVVGEVDVKAKMKKLLTLSAQTIVSNTSVIGENPHQLLPTRMETQSVIATPLPEQARPIRNFSQNVANQIQGRTLNDGITRIELAPRGLGNVLIELQTKEAGDIQVIVKAENSAVLHALRTDREVLLSVLSNEISSQESIDLEFEEFSEGQFNPDGDGLNLDEELAQSELENEDIEDSTNTSSGRQRPLGVGQVDILT